MELKRFVGDDSKAARLVMSKAAALSNGCPAVGERAVVGLLFVSFSDEPPSRSRSRAPTATTGTSESASAG